MIPAKGTIPTLIEFSLEAAMEGVRTTSFIPIDLSDEEIREKIHDAVRAISALQKTLLDKGLMTWDTPIGRQGRYFLDHSLDTVSVALAQGVRGSSSAKGA